MKIVSQKPTPRFVITEFEDGHIELLPFRVDENGEKYVEMLPNDDPTIG